MHDYVIVNGELYHFGIKGMKWGIRRFQKKDGSLTSAGRRRYDDSPKPAKVYKIPEKKSNHRLNLEKKYREAGMSKKDAEQAAAKRIRTEKIVLGAAAVTVAACVAANAYRKYSVDTVLSENTDFQRIMKLKVGDQIAPGRQYLAYHKADKTKYKGMLGKTFLDQKNMGMHNLDIQNVTVKMKERVKIASPKRARDTFESLYKNDPEFRDLAEKSIEQFSAQKFAFGPKLQKVYNNIDRNGGKLNGRMLRGAGYDAFNVGLVNDSPEGKRAAEKFYEALRKQGVNAIQDVNDKKYSGYYSKNPIIVFGGDYSYKGKAMAEEQIASNFKKAYADILLKSTAEAATPFVAAYGGYKLVTTAADMNANTKQRTTKKRKR